jgi:dTDP-4-amino-4,6-dideoxygalactose transaminase
MQIPFNRPYTVGTETAYISEAVQNGHLSGNGPFSDRCSRRLKEMTGATGVLLTPSCTAALEMIAMLAEVGPGDEVIMPSFTFVTTATAFVLRGAVPVFVDIRPDTLNLDERLVEAAITERTRAIMAVHYAGVGCAMEELADIARRHDLLLLEDAAQGVMATQAGRPLGGIGDLSALSFHETKNVTCGEGGALLVNDERWLQRAEILHEKGTNRQRFFRGQVDKYTWVDIGSSYVLSDLNAAFLWAQLERAEEITQMRLAVWQRYDEAFAELEASGWVRRPVIPDDCRHNAHMYYLLMESQEERARLIAHLAEQQIQAVFHYIPLHTAPAGLTHGRPAAPLPVTQDTSDRLVRLPLFPDLDDTMLDRIIDGVLDAAPVSRSHRA